MSDTILSYTQAQSKPIKKYVFLFLLISREYDLDKVKEVHNPSIRFPVKEKYGNTLVDLVFDDDTVLTIAGSVDLPYSIELVTKVLSSSWL